MHGTECERLCKQQANLVIMLCHVQERPPSVLCPVLPNATSPVFRRLFSGLFVCLPEPNPDRVARLHNNFRLHN